MTRVYSCFYSWHTSLFGRTWEDQFDTVGEDVGGPMTQHGTQLPWPDTCQCVFEFVLQDVMPSENCGPQGCRASLQGVV
jgi:hypothetical protein